MLNFPDIIDKISYMGQLVLCTLLALRVPILWLVLLVPAALGCVVGYLISQTASAACWGAGVGVGVGFILLMLGVAVMPGPQG